MADASAAPVLTPDDTTRPYPWLGAPAPWPPLPSPRPTEPEEGTP